MGGGRCLQLLPFYPAGETILSPSVKARLVTPCLSDLWVEEDPPPGGPCTHASPSGLLTPGQGHRCRPLCGNIRELGLGAPILLVWQMLLNDCRAPIQTWGGEGQALVWAWGGEGRVPARAWGGKGPALSGSWFHHTYGSGRGTAWGLQGGLGLGGTRVQMPCLMHYLKVDKDSP